MPIEHSIQKARSGRWSDLMSFLWDLVGLGHELVHLRDEMREIIKGKPDAENSSRD